MSEYGPEGSSGGGHPGWIQSPAFDMATFILVPLSSLVVLGAVVGWPYGMALVVACTYFVGIPHYMSSLTFFMGDDNLRHYRSRWVAFFVGPAVILAAVVTLRALGYHAVVTNTMFTWNVWHVSLQSAGILAIYRRLNGGPYAEQHVAKWAIVLWNGALAFWFIDRYPPMHAWISAVHPDASTLLRWVLLGGAMVYLVRFGRMLADRPRPVSVPETAFLASSLLLFLPYLWVPDTDLATFGMLMGHFIQYLAIVWLLQRRKYANRPGTLRQRILGRVSASPLLLFATIGGTGLAFYGAEALAGSVGWPMAYVVLWNGLTLVHFYLDGLIWAFRRPFVRETIGAYLMPSSGPAS